jgi:hypothetical protein
MDTQPATDTAHAIDRTPRKGAVILKDWIKAPDGTNRIGVYGKITVCEAKATVGFSPAKTESNWFAYVENDETKAAMAILGCQIRAIYFTEKEPTHTDTFIV